jgi:hypothetical protein
MSNDIFKNTPLHLFDSITKTQQLVNKSLGGLNFDKLSSINEISNKMSKMPNYNLASGLQSVLNNNTLRNFQTSALTMQMENFNYIDSLTSPFASISKNLQKIVLEQESLISKMTIPQSFLPPNFNRWVENMNAVQIPNFVKGIEGILPLIESQKQITNNLSAVLSNSFKIYSTAVIENENWEDFEEEEDKFEQLLSIVNKINEDQKVTQEDIKNINTILITKKFDKVGFIYFAISLLFSLLLYYNPLPTPTESRKEIEIENSAKEEFSKTLNILSIEQRVAKANVYLRTKPNLKAGKVFLVPKSSWVYVQKINHKWIYIIFINNEKQVCSGWAYKKYFERTKN